MSYVNVTWGDVVRFEVGDKSFIWNFNGTRNSFDLAQVAPPEVLGRKVTAYVAPDPRAFGAVDQPNAVVREPLPLNASLREAASACRRRGR